MKKAGWKQALPWVMGLNCVLMGYNGVDNLMEQDFLLGALGIGVALVWLVLLVREWRNS